MKNWGLMLAPLGLVLCGMSVLYLKLNPAVKVTPDMLQGPLSYLPWLAAAAVLALLVQTVLIRRRLDTFLFPIVLTLAGVGVVEIARLKPSLLVRQLQWLCIAMIVLILVVRFWDRIRRMLDYPYLLGVGCVLLLGLPLIFGTEIGGSRNWLVLGPISAQPSEFGKILIIFFLGAYLSDHRRVLTLPSHRFLFLQLPPLRFIAPLICIWGLAVLMFVVEKDLGSALLFFGMAVLMTYMATGSKSYVFLAMAFMSVAATASYAMFAHVRVRFDIWLDPWKDPLDTGFQAIQGLIAFNNGGFFGTGLGHGFQKLQYLPAAYTDFLYAALGEELGLLGTLGVLFLFACWTLRLHRLYARTEDPLRASLLWGVTLTVVLPLFINVGGVTKLMPLTGMPLPFLSYGGSSLVTMWFRVGLLLRLCREEPLGVEVRSS